MHGDRVRNDGAVYHGMLGRPQNLPDAFYRARSRTTGSRSGNKQHHRIRMAFLRVAVAGRQCRGQVRDCARHPGHGETGLRHPATGRDRVPNTARSRTACRQDVMHARDAIWTSVRARKDQVQCTLVGPAPFVVEHRFDRDRHFGLRQVSPNRHRRRAPARRRLHRSRRPCQARFDPIIPRRNRMGRFVNRAGRTFDPDNPRSRQVSLPQDHTSIHSGAKTRRRESQRGSR